LSIHHPHLLVIDDDRAVCALVARQVVDARCAVHHARDGEEGLELTRSIRPDVVLCDRGPSGLDGISYTSAVKADPALRNTYVALFTAHGAPEQQIQGLDAGADACLVKPVAVDELRAFVRVGLRVRQLQRELAQSERRAALTELARTLTREISDPVTALFGHVELLTRYVDRGEEERVRHHVRQAGLISHRLAETARRLAAIDESTNEAFPLDTPASDPP